jgi:hypothetical protein
MSVLSYEEEDTYAHLLATLTPRKTQANSETVSALVHLLHKSQCQKRPTTVSKETYYIRALVHLLHKSTMGPPPCVLVSLQRLHLGDLLQVRPSVT